MRGLHGGGVDDPGGEDAQPQGPHEHEHHEAEVTHRLQHHHRQHNTPEIMRRTHTESCVLGHLGQLHPVVSEVVHQDHQRSDPANMEDNKYLVDRRIEEVSCSPEHLRGPAEGEQGEGGEVVDEHLPPVLQHQSQCRHQTRPLAGVQQCLESATKASLIVERIFKV